MLTSIHHAFQTLGRDTVRHYWYLWNTHGQREVPEHVRLEYLWGMKLAWILGGRDHGPTAKVTLEPSIKDAQVTARTSPHATRYKMIKKKARRSGD